eukprot:TRINITY_DN90_c0_g1_i5.p1 TRINITY_DN90_c0_g1~~TRINITY_DN90_c0_g1_i5.p1  ORF type:complete len:187 (-),score=41.20 TRINITY_DN90_c0_g1_i5:65-625(-)
MRVILVTLAIVILAAFSQTPPSLSDNFFADVEASFNGAGRLNAQTWEDYDIKRARIDGHPDDGRPAFREFLFWDQGKRYTVDDERRTCQTGTLNGTMVPAFSWVSSATQNKFPCHSHVRVGDIGTEWDGSGSSSDRHLCANSAGTTPYWLERTRENRTEYFVFNIFRPQTPQNTTWNLPPFCTSQN